MADVNKTVDIVFGAQDTDLTSTIGKISADLSTFDSAIQGAADPVANFTKSLLATEAAIGAAGVALVGFAINEAGTFKGSINEIAALFDGTAEQSKVLGDNLLEFSTKSSASIEQINAATFTAISTGTEWTEVTKLLAQAQELSVAGSTDLGTAMGALTRTMNAYGLETTEAERVSNALFVAAQQGDTDLTKLGSSFGKLATDASGAGVSLDDALASVSALTVAGISTEESMTKLRQLFIALSAPSDDLAKAMGATTLETSSLQEVMQNLNTVTGGSSVKLRELISSQEAITAAMILSEDASGTFQSALDAMADKAGKVSAAYKLMEEDFSKVNQRLANNVQAVLIKIGDDLLNEYGSLGNALGDIFKSIGVSLDTGVLQTLTKSLESFLADVGNTLDGVATALPQALNNLNFDGLLSSFSNLSAEFGEVFDSLFGDDLDLTKPEDLAKALQVAVNLVESFVNITAGIIDQFTPVFDAIGQAGQELAGTSQETDAALGKFLGAVTGLQQFGTALGTVLFALKESQTEITAVFDTFIGAGKAVTNALQVAFDGVAIIILRTLETIANAFELVTPDVIGDPWGDIAKSIGEVADAAGQNFNRNLSEAGDGLKQLGEGVGLVNKDVTKASESIKKFSDIVEITATPIEGVNEQIEALQDKLDSVGLTAEESAIFFDLLQQKQTMLTVTTESVADATGKAEAATKKSIVTVDKATKSTEDLAKKQAEAVRQTNALELQLLELASNERIAVFEFTAAVKIAEFEADAEKFVAITEGLSSVAVSANQVITDLFSHEAPDWDKFGFATESAVRSATERADKANAALIELQKAQTKNLEEKTRQLARGDSEIKISADNLAPELQKVLESLIDNIRIQAINNGLEILT